MLAGTATRIIEIEKRVCRIYLLKSQADPEIDDAHIALLKLPGRRNELILAQRSTRPGIVHAFTST